MRTLIPHVRIQTAVAWHKWNTLMPKKIREIVADLITAGFREESGGGKGSQAIEAINEND